MAPPPDSQPRHVCSAKAIYNSLLESRRWHIRVPESPEELSAREGDGASLSSPSGRRIDILSRSFAAGIDSRFLTATPPQQQQQRPGRKTLTMLQSALVSVHSVGQSQASWGCFVVLGLFREVLGAVDATVEDAVLRKKEQKDVELDKKIIALRKKNEALMRRYQEIEEDRKRAEQEGMAVTSRRARPDGLTITITKAHNEKRVVSEKRGSGCSPAGIGSEEEEDDEGSDHLFTFRMGKRVQLAVTMDNKAKGKRIVSEKRGLECLGSPGEAPDVSEEEMDQLVAFRRGRRMQIAITMDKADEKRTMEKRRAEGDKYSEVRKERGKSPQKSPGDKSCPLTGRERSEYMRWKKERDQIDLERLARHKNARGEWRRAWDIEKSERM
ncbi:hypothetical protein lerEdw1_017272 [Lerista edwardsae]|nr:hypothetical protein lerEdw1_017272 [Lerista edwardsae]